MGKLDEEWLDDFLKDGNELQHATDEESNCHEYVSWLLGALHNEWKRIEGYKDPNPKNKGQCQSSFNEFNDKIK